MINSLINCVCKGSFSKAIIEILSTWLKIFSALSICSISIFATCWHKFSGLSNPYMINWLINCWVKGSFSYPAISKLSLCSKIFSGLLNAYNSTSSFLWISFSSLIISSMKSWLIVCTINSSLSNPTIWILSLANISKSGIGSFSIINSWVLWIKFSSFWIPSIFNSFIFCLKSSSFS